MDLVDATFAYVREVVVNWFAGTSMAGGMLQSLIVDGIIGGVGSVLIFLPQIVFLFMFIAILEDCGYMARAAFLMDRLLRGRRYGRAREHDHADERVSREGVVHVAIHVERTPERRCQPIRSRGETPSPKADFRPMNRVDCSDGSRPLRCPSHQALKHCPHTHPLREAKSCPN